MDNVISFTPSELCSIIISVCAAIVTISAAIGVIFKSLEKLKAPEKAQNERLNTIDSKLSEHDKILKQFREYFKNDDNRFIAIENSNKITQSALLALLKHAINGDDLESLKTAERSLEEYLIQK